MQLLMNIHFSARSYRVNMPCMKTIAADLMSRIASRLAESIAALGSRIWHVSRPPDWLRRDVGLSDAERPRPWQYYL